MIPLALFALGGCIAITGASDRIVVGDLAAALPGLAGVALDQPVALAPAPGVQRVFHVPELQRLALKFQLTTTPESDVCFERRLTPLDSARMLDAMQRQLPQARIEIVEHSKFNVPEGEIEFPIVGLRQTPTGGFWSGAVRYAGGRKYAIWAKVKVLVSAPRVVAVEPLKAGREIDATQLRVEMREEFPSAGLYAATIEELAGKLLRRPVNAGAAISTQWVEAPKDVVRGETVRVEVRSGGAILEFEGKAETTGSIGQNILVLNPGSKKRFQARVEGKGRATVTARTSAAGGSGPAPQPPAAAASTPASPRSPAAGGSGPAAAQPPAAAASAPAPPRTPAASGSGPAAPQPQKGTL